MEKFNCPKCDKEIDNSFSYCPNCGNYLIGLNPKRTQNKAEGDQKKKKFYDDQTYVIFLLIFLFPVGLYALWKTETMDIKNKIVFSCIFGFLIIGTIITNINDDKIENDNKQIENTKNKGKAKNKISQAQEKIKSKDIQEAKKYLKDADSLYLENNNKASQLLSKIDKISSLSYAKEKLIDMNDQDFQKLETGTLEKEYLKNESLNKIFIDFLKENADKRKVWIERRNQVIESRKEENRRKREEERRKENIEKQFGLTWGGGKKHYKFERIIKNAMHDPDSYEHVETKHWEREDYIIVQIKFRGNNAFGAKVLNTKQAKFTIDGKFIEEIR